MKRRINKEEANNLECTDDLNKIADVGDDRGAETRRELRHGMNLTGKEVESCRWCLVITPIVATLPLRRMQHNEGPLFFGFVEKSLFCFTLSWR